MIHQILEQGIAFINASWNKLFLKTKNTANSILQCWAAGFLEGFLTSESIYNHLSNIKRVFLGRVEFILGKQEQYEQLKDIYRTVDKYLSEKLKVEYFLSLEKEEQQKWIYYSCIRAQLEGLEKGYNANGDVKIEKEDFYILNSVGNIDELKMYLDAKDFKFDEEETKFYYKPNLNKVRS